MKKFNVDEFVLKMPEEDFSKRIGIRKPKKDGCVVQITSVHRTGYAYVHFGVQDGKRINIGAHRAALLRAKGWPPDNKPFACHTCRFRSCVSPDHLYWGSRSDNMKDRQKDGTCNFSKVYGENHHKTKIGSACIALIFNEYYETNISINSIAKKHNISPTSVTLLIKGVIRKRETSMLRKKFENKKRLPVFRDASTRLGGAKITEQDVKVVWQRLCNLESVKSISAEMKISGQTVSNIRSGRQWGHVTDGLPKIPDDPRRQKGRIFGSGRENSKLDESKALIIKKMLANGATQLTVANAFCVSPSAVQSIANGKTWRHVNLGDTRWG